MRAMKSFETQIAKPAGFEVTIRCCLALLLMGTGWASDLSSYHCRNWQTDAGLPNNTVQAVVQTRDGYLWVGTQYGLARFDGDRFTIFRRGNVPEMKNANVLGLLEARDGS